MIARFWSAQTTPALSDAYLHHFEQAVQPQLQRLDGFLGVTVCTRPFPGAVEIVVTTYWKSFAAIDAFAGADREAPWLPLKPPRCSPISTSACVTTKLGYLSFPSLPLGRVSAVDSALYGAVPLSIRAF